MLTIHKNWLPGSASQPMQCSDTELRAVSSQTNSVLRVKNEQFGHAHAALSVREN